MTFNLKEPQIKLSVSYICIFWWIVFNLECKPTFFQMSTKDNTHSYLMVNLLIPSYVTMINGSLAWSFFVFSFSFRLENCQLVFFEESHISLFFATGLKFYLIISLLASGPTRLPKFMSYCSCPTKTFRESFSSCVLTFTLLWLVDMD